MCIELEIKRVVKRVVSLLVEHQYDEIYQADLIKDYGADELKISIDTYLAAWPGTKLVHPPDSAFDSTEIDSTEVDETYYHAEINLWQNTDRKVGQGPFVLGLDIYQENEQCRYSVVHLAP